MEEPSHTTRINRLFSNRSVAAPRAAATAHPVERKGFVSGLQIGMRREKTLHTRFIGKDILAASAIVLDRQSVLREQ